MEERKLRIASIETWVVNVPLVNPFTSSFETKSGTTRTIVRVRDEEGHEGWGETMHGRPTAALIDRIAPRFLGMDVRAHADVRRRAHMVPFFHGYIGYCAIAGIEMATLDLSCRVAGMPLHAFLGGAVRHSIPITCLLTRSDIDEKQQRELPRRLAEVALEKVSQGRFTSLKFKGSTDVRFDVSVMRALREALPRIGLRVDPNAAWSVPDSIWAGRAMEPLELEYLEDPCDGLAGMAAVHAAVRIPLCTNMCVVRLEDLPPAVSLRAVDVVHADVHKWGGVKATMDMYAICQAFGLGVNFHSGGELGISTSCHLQVAAAMEQLPYAIDSMYYLTEDDVLRERITLHDGCLSLPDGPGLGVTVDPDRLRHYAERNRSEGDHTL